jgi:branched-chain amino acid transport system ATP-binding protein
MLLTVENLDVSYGAIAALRGVSLEIDQGQIVSLIGSNGAGKTTLLRTISGLLRPRQGTILWNHKGVAAGLQTLRPDAIVRLGISHVPEGRQVFANLTVRENLLLGGYQHPQHGLAAELNPIYELFPVLAERSKQLAGTLSGGEQQQLAIGRALMAKPALLLLDEPSLGLAPIAAAEVFALIRRIAAAGVTILLVAQNADLALQVADRGYVMESGRVTLAGTSADLRASDHVRGAYLAGAAAPASPSRTAPPERREGEASGG